MIEEKEKWHYLTLSWLSSDEDKGVEKNNGPWLKPLVFDSSTTTYLISPLSHFILAFNISL